ncbi:hypothetical protein Vi05172_g12924 [Venturia inaequalis]|uniref:Uncharacterized protein n=2 Tax=Venturia inaequalis TaxID=5025 RepID=A0A8H3VPI8_VENIN|nr:hypothetical protein EG327_011364 [Venturia inaequalis]RDI77095.1 hypothetical protein Vi05172_g12924 [Venturia inaequalis]
MAGPSGAYHILEQAFQNQSASSLDNPNLSPRGHVLSKTIRTPVTTFESSYVREKNGAHSESSSPSSPLMPPFAHHGHHAGLPPTPPSHSNERSSQVDYNPGMRAQSGARLLALRTSNAKTTPPNARSPPTPDTTPPTRDATPPTRDTTSPTSSLPPRDNLLRMPSSRAESFSTAREEPWSSDEERKSRNEKFRVPTENGPRLEYVGRYGHNIDIQQDDSDTPTEHVGPSPKARKVFAESKRMTSGSPTQLPDGEWDPDVMRNVTVRRRKPPRLTSPRKLDDDDRVKKREILPKLVTGSSEEEELGPTTPHLTEFGQTIGWPKAPNQTRIRDSDSRRLSDMSSNSTTVVEAVVTISSPRRQRTLRHVSRNLSLRSDAGSSIDSTPSPRSTRTSLASEELPSRRLTHKRASLSITSPRVSGNSDMLMSGQPLLNNPLTYRPEHNAMRANVYSTDYREWTLDPPPALSSIYQRRASAGHVPKPRNLSEPIKYRMSPLQIKPTRVTSPVRGPFEESFQYSMRRIASEKKRESYPTRLATQRALRQADGLAALPEPKITRPSIDEQIKARPGSPTALELMHAFPSPGKSSLKKTILSTSERSRSRPSIDASTAGSVRRVSFDRSTIGTYELARTSLDHSHLHPDDSRAGRPLLTPFSESSDHQLEISEATAVNLYPHNNNSLLVVQQMARSAELQSSGPTVQDLPIQPALTVQPATPPSLSAEVINVDSPLRHPRKPPHPPLQAPVIQICPATPAEELETSPFDEAGRRPRLSKRSLSLKEHAMQFSETLMQPIFPKSNSFKRRSAYQKKRKSEPTQKANTLHPFWQPRGFWDEFIDSEDESDEEDRLPAGGDTSDVVLARSMATRVLDSVRSSGGFLIGKSLGVERVGSNKRRHHVSLPVGLGKRTSSHVLRSTSEGTLRSLKSLESLSRKSQQMKKWNPKNWRVHYVGLGGMRAAWKEKQASKRRQKLRDSIGVRYMVEGAPVV